MELRHFIGAAIASVKGQDYPNVECLVVDNASTDNSIEVITESIAEDNRFRLIQLPENYGQLGAAFKVLPEVKGHFVNFLDADDILFENFLSTHIQVHLVTAAPVCFTSSAFITIAANGEIVAGCAGLTYRRDDRIKKCLPKVRDPALHTIDDEYYRNLRKVTFDAPAEIGHWVWWQGTSNVIRREMLKALVFDNVGVPHFGGLDGYFLMPMFAMSGTNLISAALSAYRIHGDNDHARLPEVRDLRNGNEAAYLRNTAAKKLAFISLIRNSDKVIEIAQPSAYFQIIKIVGENAIDSLFVDTAFSDPEVRAALEKSYPFLVEVFGERTVIRRLRALVKLTHLATIIANAYQWRIPFATVRRFCAVGLRKPKLKAKKRIAGRT